MKKSDLNCLEAVETMHAVFVIATLFQRALPAAHVANTAGQQVAGTLCNLCVKEAKASDRSGVQSKFS